MHKKKHFFVYKPLKFDASVSAIGFVDVALACYY